MKNIREKLGALAFAGIVLTLAFGASAQGRSPNVAATTSGETPSVQIGVVAQRYPWNGIVDIQYRTPNCGTNRVVTIKANGLELGKAKGTAGRLATASFDLNTAAGGAFKNTALKNVKLTATLDK